MSGHAVLTAETVDDCVIDQGWDRYSAEDHTIWRMLFERQRRTLGGHVAKEYIDGIEALVIGAEAIPFFERMNE